MIQIPAGTCDLGNDPGEEEGMYDYESPKRRNVNIAAFALAAVPVVSYAIHEIPILLETTNP